MTVMPTLEGGLRIDANESDDWMLLRAIISDANSCKTDLASRLSAFINPSAGSEDWMEYVVPDLRVEFQDELAEIGALIESAVFHANHGPGAIWITRDNAFTWYSALNQARLALEEIYHFGPEDGADPLAMTPPEQSAFIRSGFYSDVQSLLLQHVLK